MAEPGLSSEPEAYIVHSTDGTQEDAVLQTLLGTYVESGQNHGRKVFKRALADGIPVFLYYWDGRHGEENRGWWFGKKLGGPFVWALNKSLSLCPPSTGWRTSTDVNGSISFRISRADVKLEESSGAGSRDDILTVIASAEEALKEARQAHEGIGASALRAVRPNLLAEMRHLGDAMKRLQRRRLGCPPEELEECAELTERVAAAQSKMGEELRQGLGADDREKGESAEMHTWLPEAVGKVKALDEALEVALAFWQEVERGEEDIEEFKKAVARTEEAALAAQRLVIEARVYLKEKQAAAQRFGGAVRQWAVTELGRLLAQVAKTDQRLRPMRGVRNKLVARIQVQKIEAQLLEQLYPAEVSVDRAEEAAALVQDQASLAQAQKAVSTASEHIAAVLLRIQNKRLDMQGLVHDGLASVEARAKAAQFRLAELQELHEAEAQKAVSSTISKEVRERIEDVELAVKTAEEAEGPFLLGIEELPMEETLAAAAACDKACAAAMSAAGNAKRLLLEKTLEAKRLQPELATELCEELEKQKQRLEILKETVAEMKRSNVERRAGVVRREVNGLVGAVEAICEEVVAAGAALEDEVKLASSTAIAAAQEKVLGLEKSMRTALTEARQAVAARQLEAKGQAGLEGLGSELMKGQTRLTVAERRGARCRELAAAVQPRVQPRSLRRSQELLEDAAAKVEAVAPGDAAAAAKAEAALRMAVTAMELQVKDAEQQQGLQEQVKGAEALQQRLQGLRFQQGEEGTAQRLLQDSEAKILAAEETAAAVLAKKAASVRGGRSLTVEEVVVLMKDVSVGLCAVGSAKTVLAMKRLAAKRLKTTSKPLGEMDALQRRLSVCSGCLVAQRQLLAAHKLLAMKRLALQSSAEVLEKVSELQQRINLLQSAEASDEELRDLNNFLCDTETGLEATVADLEALERAAKSDGGQPALLKEVRSRLEAMAVARQSLQRLVGELAQVKRRAKPNEVPEDCRQRVESLQRQLTGAGSPLQGEEVVAPAVQQQPASETASEAECVESPSKPSCKPSQEHSREQQPSSRPSMAPGLLVKKDIKENMKEEYKSKKRKKRKRERSPILQERSPILRERSPIKREKKHERSRVASSGSFTKPTSSEGLARVRPRGSVADFMPSRSGTLRVVS